ncbi:WD40/YVTN/BNR-like repeat-containing protein [Stieleria varia]|nr:hypothetical protein [Stieleria varia]
MPNILGRHLIVVLFFLSLASGNLTGQDVLRIESQGTGVEASFRGIAVRSATECWVSGSGGTVIRTTDSGQKWSVVQVPGSEDLDFRDIALPQPNVVLLMSAGPGNLSRIFRSDDNGASWSTVLTNDDERGFFNAIDFFDAERGVLVGDPIDGRLDLYQSSDGGQNWVAGQGPRVKEGEYGFAASGTNLTLVADRYVFVATGGSIARVFHSQDQCKTWSIATPPVTHGNESSGIFSIAFRDTQHGVIVGGDYKAPTLDRGNVARTDDGGVTWKLADSPPKVPHKACVGHLAENTWLAVGRTGVAISNDDGVSWHQQSDQSYYTFDFDQRSGIGWMAGSDGRVARFSVTPTSRNASDTGESLSH